MGGVSMLQAATPPCTPLWCEPLVLALYIYIYIDPCISMLLPGLRGVVLQVVVLCIAGWQAVAVLAWLPFPWVGNSLMAAEAIHCQDKLCCLTIPLLLTTRRLPSGGAGCICMDTGIVTQAGRMWLVSVQSSELVPQGWWQYVTLAYIHMDTHHGVSIHGASS